MRVLYVEMASGFGGSLTGLLQLIDHLPTEIEPVLVTGFDARRYIKIPDDLSYEFFEANSSRIKPSPSVQRLTKLYPRNPRSPVRQLAGTIRDLTFQYRNDARPWIKYLAGIIERYHPDLIHTANSALCNAPAALVGRRRNIPTVGYQKGFEANLFPNRFVLNRGWFSHHIASSTPVAGRLFELGLRRDRCTVMFEPIEPAGNGSAKARGNGRPPVVAMYSMLTKWKGQDVFLRAIAKVLERYRDPVRIILAGTSPDGNPDYPNSLKALAAELNIADQVEFCGHVSDISGMLSQTDVAVHASVEPEPFGRVIGEAMIAGVAVVATKGGGAGEIVQHERTGLHVPMGDAEAMADAIERLLRKPDLRKELGQRARDFALSEFKPEVHAQKVVALYEEVLSRQ